MDPLAIIESHSAELHGYGIRRIGVFGSVARGSASAVSDVDVYVEFEQREKTFDNFMAVYELLEELFHRHVDLVTGDSLRPDKARLILPTVRYARIHP